MLLFPPGPVYLCAATSRDLAIRPRLGAAALPALSRQARGAPGGWSQVVSPVTVFHHTYRPAPSFTASHVPGAAAGAAVDEDWTPAPPAKFIFEKLSAALCRLPPPPLELGMPFVSAAALLFSDHFVYRNPNTQMTRTTMTKMMMTVAAPESSSPPPPPPPPDLRRPAFGFTATRSQISGRVVPMFSMVRTPSMPRVNWNGATRFPN